jgi:hypothetical protein
MLHTLSTCVLELERFPTGGALPPDGRSPSPLLPPLMTMYVVLLAAAPMHVYTAEIMLGVYRQAACIHQNMYTTYDNIPSSHLLAPPACTIACHVSCKDKCM